MNILLESGARPVIGHRGNCAFAPENTIESFAQAVSLGADAIEFDVRVTADGIPVVHHDATVNRTTDGSGEISRMTFDELKELDAGARFTADGGKTFPYAGKGHRIPKFDEVLEAFPSTPVLIEIKTALTATGIRRSIENHDAEARSLVDAMDIRAIRIFADSSIAVGAARNDVARLMSEVLLNRPVTPFSYSALCVPLSWNGLPLPVRRFAKVAPSQHCRVHVWTINDPSVAKSLWASGVNGIISDDPAIILTARNSLPVLSS